MSQNIKIVLLEDDSLQSEVAATYLQRALSASITVLETESEFVRQLPSIADSPPDVFVIDINLRWSDPTQEMPDAPQQVLDEGKQFAGFRCCELLSGREETRGVPVVFYSIFDQSHFEHRLLKLPKWVVYVQKDNLPLLAEAIRQLTNRAESADLRS